MTSFFDEIAKNKVKSMLLMAVFSAFFVGIIYVIAIFAGLGIFGLVLGIVLVGLYAAFVYKSGDKMVLKMSGAVPADKQQYQTLYNLVEGLSSAMQVPMPNIYIIRDNNPNAFATGRNKKHAAIAVTTGLLSMMSKEELEGVIAHEMSHIGDNDIQFMMVAVIFAGVIGIVAAFARNMLWFGGLGRGRNNGGGMVIIIALVLGILAPIFATLIRLAISRRREYMADANGARVIRAPAYLASALGKIRDYSNLQTARPVRRANEMTAPLYFSSPFSKKSILNLFSTHPPIEERIDRLKQMY